MLPHLGNLVWPGLPLFEDQKSPYRLKWKEALPRSFSLKKQRTTFKIVVRSWPPPSYEKLRAAKSHLTTKKVRSKIVWLSSLTKSKACRPASKLNWKLWFDQPWYVFLYKPDSEHLIQWKFIVISSLDISTLIKMTEIKLMQNIYSSLESLCNMWDV